MRGLRIHGVRDVRVDEIAEPRPREGEVLLRVTAVGLCGSDLHWYKEAAIGDARVVEPFVPGHEFVGVIESGPRRGERVAGDPADPCGTCEPCVRGLEHLCDQMRFAGHVPVDGALRQRMAWPSRLLHRVPDAVSDDAAVLLEPFGVALHALAIARVRPSICASVHGCGPLGLLVITALRAQGVDRIIATDPLSHRAAAAHALGAEINVGGAPDRVDVAFECSGEDDALDSAIADTRPGGTVVLAGIPRGDTTTFHAAGARRKELALLLCRRMRSDDLARAINLVELTGLDLAQLVTHRFDLADGPRAFETLAARSGIKVVVRPS